MVVIVKIDLSDQPDNEKNADMRRAAKAFSNDPKSIKVKKYKHENIHRLETRFCMQPIAHYKVVDRIFDEFKFASENYDDFLDISVSFRK